MKSKPAYNCGKRTKKGIAAAAMSLLFFDRPYMVDADFLKKANKYLLYFEGTDTAKPSHLEATVAQSCE